MFPPPPYTCNMMHGLRSNDYFLTQDTKYKVQSASPLVSVDIVMHKVFKL